MEFRHFSLASNDTTLAAIAAEAAGVQDRQWQYLDTFFRNQDAARLRGVDEQFLREVAEAVPELDTEQWADDFASPTSQDARPRGRRGSPPSSSSPPSPPWSSPAPAGQRQLEDKPTIAEIQAAVDQVSSSD